MGSFDSGFRMGQSAYQQALDNRRQQEQDERQKVLDALAKESHDQSIALGRQQLDAGARAAEIERTNRAAGEEYADTISGFKNTSGISNAGVRGLLKSRATPEEGQAFVDTTARLGNAEAASLGLEPAYKVSAPGAPTISRGPALSERERYEALATMYAKQHNWKEHGAAKDQAVDAQIGEFTSDAYKTLKDPTARAKAVDVLSSGHYAGVPIHSVGDIKDAKGNVTGHKFVVISGGTSKELTFSDAQIAKFMAGEQALNAGYGAKGMALIEGVSKDIAAVIKEYNAGVKTSVETANTGQTGVDTANYQGVMGNAATVKAEADRVTAAAAARREATAAKESAERITDLKDARARRAEAAKIAEEFYKMTPDEQAGSKGQAKLREFNLANAKINGQISLSSPGAGGAAAQARMEAKYNTDNRWADAEKQLMARDTAPENILVQKEAFYARAGFAPPAAFTEIMRGRDDKGNPLKPEQVAEFNTRFPHTPIDPSTLPWLKKQLEASSPTVAAPTPNATNGTPARRGGLPLASDMDARRDAVRQGRVGPADMGISTSPRRGMPPGGAYYNGKTYPSVAAAQEAWIRGSGD